MKHQTWKQLLVLAAIILFLAGCSISYSSGKSSDSSKSISGSSSPSGNSDTDQFSYKNDIREFTRSVARSERTSESFLRDVGRIAERHGITDWERDRSTFTAIGSGLKAAGVSQKNAASLTFLQGIVSENQAVMSYVEEGYNS